MELAAGKTKHSCIPGLMELVKPWTIFKVE
jgi:hypothetical protein